MKTVTIPETRLFDEKTYKFIRVKEHTLQLEHSLVSISKWESKWHKPFFSKERKTTEEMLDYVKCMTITQNVDPLVYVSIPGDVLEDIGHYIEDPMTATWFSNTKQGPPNREVITSELIYYWMIQFNIPSQYEKWHLNRLMTLIRICGIKNSPSKKMTRKESLSRMAELNKQRRKATGSKG